MILRKGSNPEVDSYSAFFENDHKTPTGLHGYLQSLGVTEIDLAGLATDYCVAYSALDAAKLGYKVKVLKPHAEPLIWMVHLKRPEQICVQPISRWSVKWSISQPVSGTIMED